VENVNEAGSLIQTVILKSDARAYRAPSWLKDKSGNGNLLWRVDALDQAGKPIGETARFGLKAYPLTVALTIIHYPLTIIRQG